MRYPETIEWISASGNIDGYSVRSFAFAAAVFCPIHVTNETNLKVECRRHGDQAGGESAELVSVLRNSPSLLASFSDSDHTPTERKLNLRREGESIH
jgi:hypothetical protein